MALPPASEGDIKIAKNQEVQTDAINYNTAAFEALGSKLSGGFDGLRAGVASLGKSAQLSLDFMKDSAQTARNQAGFALEASREQTRKMGAMFSNIGDKLAGIGSAFKSGVLDKFKSDGGGIFGKITKVLKGILLGAGLFAIFELIKRFSEGDLSKFKDAFEKIKVLFTDKIFPMLKKIYDDILVPLANFFIQTVLPILTDTFGGIIDSFMRNIDGVIQGFRMIFGSEEGGILAGITKIVLGIGTFLVESLDLVLTGILKIFGVDFGESGTLFGSIGSFFTGLYTSVRDYLSTLTFGKLFEDLLGVFGALGDWIGGLLTAADEFLMQFSLYRTIKEKMSEIWESITSLFSFPAEADTFLSQYSVYNFFKETLGEIWNTISGIFGGDFSKENLLGGAMALTDLVFYGVNVAINSIKDIFGFGSPNEPFRMSEFITNLVSDVVGYVKDIFSFDIGSILPDIEPPDLGKLIKQFIGSMLPDPKSFLGRGLYALPGTDFLKEAAMASMQGPEVAAGAGGLAGIDIDRRTQSLDQMAMRSAGQSVTDASTNIVSNNATSVKPTTVVSASPQRRRSRWETAGSFQPI